MGTPPVKAGVKASDTFRQAGANMIEIPILNVEGQQVGTLPVDEKVLGEKVRPILLKQAYVTIHANQRQGTVKTKSRKDVEGSTRKLYKQKHTGRARRGAVRTAIMKGGGRGHGKVPHSWRKDMPAKMRRLANRNAILAKALDGEIKLVDALPTYAKPSTKQFAGLLDKLHISSSCLMALCDTRHAAARSAANLENFSVTRIDRLNAFDLLNHRFLLAPSGDFSAFIKGLESAADAATAGQEAA